MSCKEVNSQRLHEAQDSLLKDPKNFWNFTKEKLRLSSIPTIVHVGNQTYSNVNDTVSAFARYFHFTVNSPTTNLSPTTVNPTKYINVKLTEDIN